MATNNTPAVELAVNFSVITWYSGLVAVFIMGIALFVAPSHAPTFGFAAVICLTVTGLLFAYYAAQEVLVLS